MPLLVEAARITPGLEVLDVGCGTGGFAREIARVADVRVTGCDRSERFLEHAQRLAGSSVQWIHGDAEGLPFEAESFDRVLLSLVLHQLTEPAGGTLTRLARNNSATRRAVDADESCPRVVAKHARSIDSRFLDDSARDGTDTAAQVRAEDAVFFNQVGDARLPLISPPERFS